MDMYNPDKGLFKHYVFEPGKPNSINGNTVLCITEDGQGKIWIGGYLQGINIIDKKTGIISGYKHDDKDIFSLSNDDVRDIMVEDSNTVWIATNGGGLNKFNPETGKFLHYLEGGENSIAGNWCLKLFEDRNGSIWIGTYSGLSIFDTENTSFLNFEKNTSPGSLCNGWIYSVAEDKTGNMWIGTANGLNYFDWDKREFSKFLSSDGLPNDVINGLLIDNENNLWLSTNKGISKYNPDSNSFKNYNESDGLQGNQFIHGSYFKGKDGKMFFGGINGLNMFYPDSILNNTFLPPVYLTDFLIYYKEVPIGTKNSPLKKSITESKKITLTHEQSVFTIKYAALNYTNPGKNQYKYKLIGFDKEWNIMGSRREATYTNLNPGTYTFKVIASNNDGYWNNNGTSILIEILPPWYKTIAFRTLIVLIIFSLIVGLYFFRISKLQQQKVQLENIVAERTCEIQEKNSMLLQQADELSEINTLLEENQQRIKQQAEGLAEANRLLEQRQQYIQEQTEELMAQKDELETVNDYLAELNSTKDKCFSIIAHDLKNPFNTILGFSELLSQNFVNLTEEKKQQFADIIFKASKNVFDLLENLLLWVRSQTNRIKFEPEIVELNHMVRENLTLLQETSHQKKIKVIFAHEKKFKVFCDRNMINIVIRNLLTNAIKFTSQEGTIRVEIQDEGDLVHTMISDTGIGIAPDEIEKLFRVDIHFTREGTGGEAGTGLGLILCKEYIVKNNGKIWVESEVGKGSTFHFTLPKSDKTS